MTRSEWQRVGVLAAVCMLGCLLIIALDVDRVRGRVSALEDQPPVVLPTCAELDALGYDGLASCIDGDGRIVTPGR